MQAEGYALKARHWHWACRPVGSWLGWMHLVGCMVPAHCMLGTSVLVMDLRTQVQLVTLSMLEGEPEGKMQHFISPSAQLRPLQGCSGNATASVLEQAQIQARAPAQRTKVMIP